MVGKTETATERPKRKRRWFQYSLGTLLVFVTVCAIPCSWFAVKMRQAEREREAATAIEKLGGAVRWDEKALGWPAWVRKLLGDDFFNSVVAVNLAGRPVTDAGLKHLKALSQLQHLNLALTSITDTGLEDLNQFSGLHDLILEGTEVTDAGMKHLNGLNQLQYLDLVRTLITDAGLEDLKGFSRLIDLRLGGTRVSNGALEHLKGLNQLHELSLALTNVSDAGLEHLKRLSRLRRLDLCGAKVSGNGAMALQEALPNCNVFFLWRRGELRAMGTVNRKTATKPLPAGARISVRKGERLTPAPDAVPPEPTPAN
jgi:hypothetical protein